MARVVYDLDELAATFRGTELEGRPLVAGVGGTVLVEGIAADRRLVSWQAARDAVAGTGRWPVFTLPGHVHHAPEPAELSSLRRAARTVNPWTVFRRLPDGEPLDEGYVARSVSSFPGPEWAPSALRDLSPPTTDMRLDWWWYDTILADPALSARFDGPPQDVAATFDSWWGYHPEMPLVLLPTPQQWLAPAWLHYHGAAGRPKAWAAALSGGDSAGRRISSPPRAPPSTSSSATGPRRATRRGSSPGSSRRSAGARRRTSGRSRWR